VGPEFEHGLELFAQGRYFEAHEAWEEEWVRAPRGERFFLQALIHFAVALHHRGEGNPEGEARQWRKGLRKLAGYLPRYRGLDTGAMYREAVMGRGLVVIRRATISGER
jgi:predicted metal-dependent hydrolase